MGLSAMKLYLLTWIVLTLNACVTQESAPVYTSGIPSRPSSALGAKGLYNEFSRANESTREAAIYRELSRGNLPNYLRRQVPVRYSAKTRSGITKRVTLWVLPDYLAIGSDADFLRIPMSPITAQKVADRFGLMLPTVRMVDAIYQQAPLRLAPRPFKPGRTMVTIPEFYRHQSTVQAQLGGRPPRGLVAGHKKDIVISKRLQTLPKRVAIYGWHQLNGRAIQPLSLVHGNWYADYSHGVRLVSSLVQIDQQTLRLVDVLKNPELAPLLSYEGTLSQARYPVNDADLRRQWMPQS